jgi:hypothetical protein
MYMLQIIANRTIDEPSRTTYRFSHIMSHDQAGVADSTNTQRKPRAPHLWLAIRHHHRYLHTLHVEKQSVARHISMEQHILLVQFNLQQFHTACHSQVT